MRMGSCCCLIMHYFGTSGGNFYLSSLDKMLQGIETLVAAFYGMIYDYSG